MTMKEFAVYNNRMLGSVMNSKSYQTSRSNYSDQLKSDYDFDEGSSVTKDEPEIKIVRGAVVDPFMLFANRMATAKGII